LAVQDTATFRREQLVAHYLELVGLAPPETFMWRFPHELSGGQRQRVAIARALVVVPTFVVADEPTSMLDVSIRTGIMHLMQSLADQMGVTYLYITHDLAVARYMASRLAVMYLGKIVEIGEMEEVLSHPLPIHQALPRGARSTFKRLIPRSRSIAKPINLIAAVSMIAAVGGTGVNEYRPWKIVAPDIMWPVM
jgi:peptide/nickel transport system ATP-binding protein